MAQILQVREALLVEGDVVLRHHDAADLRKLLRFIFDQHVYAPTPEEIAEGAEPATDFPGSVMGRTFPEWLHMLGDTHG